MVLICFEPDMLKPLISETRDDSVEVGDLPVLSSGDLLRGRRQLIIQHGRERYRLLLTKSNKLILTK
jgi:hemin uptake protein HemP